MITSTPNQLRQKILTMAYRGQSVHVGCAFSIVELMHTIYSKFVNQEKISTLHPDRDFVCLSKGHGVMAFYVCLHELGLVTQKELDDYFKDGTMLTGLADSHVPGIEISGGSLGQGITVATGVALSKKIDHSQAKIFCVVGDGEMNEGSIWESLLIAAHHKLNNFILIVDANNFQAMGTCESVLNMEPFKSKFDSFNFEALECDGHNLEQIEEKLNILTKSTDPRPKALIARTVKGHGVSFMAGNNIWHYTRLTEQTYQDAMRELQ